MKHMTAIAITSPGGPEVLRPVELPVPVPRPGEILVRVKAAGVNRPDVLQRQGAYPPPPGAPETPGLEIAGEVAALGEGARRYEVGDRVCALVPGGGYAEYAVVHEDNALPVPPGLSFTEAAAIPETFFTVWTNVFDRGRLKEGETLLVHGGSSGIGTSGIMLGKGFGAVVAAAEINIDIAAGERVSLIGSNGAGKTTFVNMITGYLKPSAGRILLGNEDITQRTPREITRRGVARSFQIPQLCLHLSVLDNMLAAMHCNRGNTQFLQPARDRASVDFSRGLLDRFGLLSQADRPVRELPGGVRKLLDIAMALTGHPMLLLLDEPTSGVSADEKFASMDTVVQAIENGRGRVRVGDSEWNARGDDAPLGAHVRVTGAEGAVLLVEALT